MSDTILEENLRFDELKSILFHQTNQIEQELRSTLPTDDETLEYPDGPYRYFSRAVSGKSFPLFLRRQADGPPEIILDPNLENNFVGLGAVVCSPDHSRVAYAVDHDGSEKFTVRIRNLECSHSGDECIPQTSGEVCWLADSRSLLYVGLDAYRRPNKLLRHTLGQAVETDELLFQDESGSTHFSLATTESRRFIILLQASHNCQTFQLIDSRTMLFSPPIQSSGSLCAVTDFADQYIGLVRKGDHSCEVIAFTSEGFPKKKIHSFTSGEVIHEMKIFGSWLVFSVYRNALSRLFALNLESGQTHDFEFPDEVYEIDILPQKSYSASHVLIRYSSFTTPTRIYSFDLDRQLREIVKEPFASLPNFNPSDFISRRVYARAQDGTLIPLTLAGSKEAMAQGGCRVLLYAYGAYGAMCQVAFNPFLVPLLTRSYIYAVAHVRGGGELGDSWHHAGRLRRKEVSCLDYQCAMQHLMESGLTFKGGITGIAESAGALAVASSFAQYPGFFRGLVLRSPFLDVIGSLLDRTQSLTPTDIEEFGDPAIENDLLAMARYSPLSTLDFHHYPGVFISCGDQDSRVPISESLAWIRKLRELNLGGAPAVIRVGKNRGHELYHNDTEAVEAIAIETGFILHCYEKGDIS